PDPCPSSGPVTGMPVTGPRGKISQLFEKSDSIAGMATAISATGLVKRFGSTRARRTRSRRRHRRAARRARALRCWQEHHHPGAARAAAGRRCQATLLGGDPWRDATRLHRRLAYVPGDVNLWPNLTGGEAIDLLGRLRCGLDPRRRADLIERFQLDPTK